jgi:acyl-CoA thioesterase
MNAQDTAELVRTAMLANDRASRGLGMAVTTIGPGRATVTMTVRDDMLNGFDICHGGLITTLADSAFAFACNSYNEMTVASAIGIDILAPARLGDRLTAIAEERSVTGRLGVYDVTVRRDDGTVIALFRGKSYRMKGRPVVAPPAA